MNVTAEASLTGAVVSAEMMRDYRRATHNTQTGLTILHERFGNPINRKALHSQMVRDLGVFVEDSDSLQSAITLGTHISEYAHFLKIIANKEQCTALKEFHLMWSRARRLQPLEFDQSFEFFFDSHPGLF